MANPYKTAVLLTGAGARISQEVAIIDQLRAKKGLVFDEATTHLTGFSSGGLNILAINGCFRADNPLSWDDFYKGQVLQNLTTKDVFTAKLPPFDTTPLRNQLNHVLSTFGYTKFGDLPFNSDVLTFSRRTIETEWANTKTPGHENLTASDLFMASAAIPAVFPAQTISTVDGKPSTFPGGKFNDGGTIGQFQRFEEHIGKFVLANGAYENMFIISPMRAKNELEEEAEMNAISKAHNLKMNLGDIHINTTAMRAFIKFLKKLQQWNKDNGPMATNIYVCIPNLDKNFGMLDFADQIPKYDAVTTWAEANPNDVAVPLDEYVARL